MNLYYTMTKRLERMNLYNKYRPKTFDEIVGNEFNKKFLKNLVKNGGYSIRREFLFTSPKIGGVGKTTSARILAKAINCKNPDNGNPCNKCENCIAFDKGAFKDFISLDGAEYNQVDKIKPIIDLAKQLPIYGKYKIIVIDEIQRMSPQALSEFLNLFEFSTNKTIFIFTTTNKEKVIQPLITRMINLEFNPLPDGEIVKYLKFIANKEGISFSDEKLRLIALEANGSLRDAISNLEKYHLAFKSVENYDSSLVNFIELLAKTMVLGIDKTEQNFYHYSDDFVKIILPKLLVQLKFGRINQLLSPVTKQVIIPKAIDLISDNYLKYKPTTIREFVLMLSFIDFSRVIFVDSKIFEEKEENIDEIELMKSQLIEYGFKEMTNEKV